MYHHFSAYVSSLGSVTNTALAAVPDDVIQRRNSNLIMSEKFNVLASLVLGTTTTRARYGNIALSFRGSNHLWPVNRTATIESIPGVQDRRDSPLALPLNEEITIEATTDAVGPAQSATLLWLAKPQWSPRLPIGLETLVTRATAVVTAATETTWTGLAPLVFERDLFNGVYAVTGCRVVAASALGFRLFFPSQQPVEGRQLRPGGLVDNAVGAVGWGPQMYGLGEWGRFHTFEPPSIQVCGDAAGGTYEVRLALTYLGSDERLLMR